MRCAAFLEAWGWVLHRCRQLFSFVASSLSLASDLFELDLFCLKSKNFVHTTTDTERCTDNGSIVIIYFRILFIAILALFFRSDDNNKTITTVVATETNPARTTRILIYERKEARKSQNCVDNLEKHL